MTLHVEVVSPERILFSGDARFVKARTTDGEIAFLSGHAPFIGALGVAELDVVLEGPAGGSSSGAGTVRMAVHGGFVEVRDDRVSVLSDVAELADQIDVDRARTAKTNAEQAIRADGNDEAAKVALARADVRLGVAG